MNAATVMMARGPFFPAKTRMSAKDRYESVLALQSLQRAIDDPELQRRLRQPLVLSSLPANLEEFVATNVEWESDSILQAPGKVTTTTPQLEWLQVLSLSGNPDLFIDLRELPRNLQSLQLSYTQLAHSTVREVLETAPAFLSLLNISFTGVALTLDMLPSARNQLKALDVSGLESNNPGSPLSLSQLQSACGESGFSLAELYLTRCSLTGTLPHLRNCTKLKVMDVSHNLLDGAVFAQLPENIELLRLNNNAIQGGLRTSELPRTLRSLDLSENHFTGEVDLSALPPQLQYLNIGHNHFSGQVNLTQLPESVKFVHMEYNNFTGAADLVDLPLGIRFIMVHHNNWDYLMPAP
ncbi:Leucine Rich Repeat family protein [Leishmania donovani]|uniref:Leucine Rich Repeat family protein n=1 Tax=Leishmania donovani TaxID=5661 RepID=A0A504XPI0_LEIDO|nr:Leucine Rich Repeat family protein [Leishmania donovani]